MARVTVKDKGWEKLFKQFSNVKKFYTAVGYFDSDQGGDVVKKAVINEYGSRDNKRPPSRPFMRRAFDKSLPEIRNISDAEVGMIFDGRSTIDKSLKRIGEFMVGQIKKTIVNENWTPNADSTIAQKGSSQPLIDTGEMRNSPSHREFYNK